VDLEEIPNKVAKLLSEAQDTARVIGEILKSATQKTKNNNPSGALEDLEELRKLLFKIDNSATDSAMILGGYQQALLKETEPAPEPVHSQEEVPSE